MPFCHHCGNAVHDRDRYCYRCGTPQPVTPNAQIVDPLASIPPRTASVICYIPGIGWIASIIVLAADRFRHDRVVRFHAFQGLYLFVAWLMNAWVIHPLAAMLNDQARFGIQTLVDLALLGMSIFMMVKASHEEAYALPIFGELAERSVAEHS